MMGIPKWNNGLNFSRNGQDYILGLFSQKKELGFTQLSCKSEINFCGMQISAIINIFSNLSYQQLPQKCSSHDHRK